MRQPPGQKEQSCDIRDYKIRVVVYGSRSITDKWRFHEEVLDYIEQFEGTPFIFITGAAKDGPDRMIMDWCRKFKYPFAAFPAKWKNPAYPNGIDMGAGFKRNAEMALVSTHGLGLWDGVSGGTKDMSARLEANNVPHRVVTMEVETK